MDKKENKNTETEDEKKEALNEGHTNLSSEIKNAHASGDGAIGRNDIDVDKDGVIDPSK